MAALGLIFSMYDVVWPLYLSARGYTTVVIGLTVSLFAVPLLVLARPGGRLADRVNRRVLMLASFLGAGACAVVYPFLHDLVPIVILGTFEACAILLVEPTLFAVIGDSTTGDNRGRAMGIGGLFQFAGSAVGAALLGTLYGVSERASFWGGALVLFAAALLSALFLPPRATGSPDDAEAGREMQPLAVLDT